MVINGSLTILMLFTRDGGAEEDTRAEDDRVKTL